MSIKTWSVFAFVCSSFIFMNGCIEPQSAFSKIPPGIWRGVLYLRETPKVVKDKDEITYKTDYTGELPFNFEVIYDNDSIFHIEIINGEERIKVTDITFGKTKAMIKDTVTFGFPVYDTYLTASYEERVLEGFWHVNYREGYKIRFKAIHGDNARFRLPQGEVEADFTGRWALDIDPETKDQFPGIAHLKQAGNKITGTIETETGDFRYLAGDVVGKKAYLSVFDGAHAYLFELKLMEDESISGLYYSGKTYLVPLVGKRDENAKLKDGFSMSKAKTGAPVSFVGTNSEGKTFSINDPANEDKIKLLLLMGTWCPNCKDATIFLKDYLKEENPQDVAIASIAFERYRDSSKLNTVLKTYKERMEVPWDVMLGGYYDKKEASQTFGIIDSIKAFPTLLFLDQKNQVRYVYTGFYGPATEEYQRFNTEFKSKIATLRDGK